MTCKDCHHCIKSEFGEWLCNLNPLDVFKLFDFSLCDYWDDETKEKT